MLHEKALLKALRELVEAVAAEIDMDACSTRLGRAVLNAEGAVDKATEVQRADAFLDQSKW